MLKNFFKTTLRNLWKNKGYSFLNIFGLAIGIACAGLIFLWVENEVNLDSFNIKKDRLYYVRENQKYETYTATFGSTPGLLAPAMQQKYPVLQIPAARVKDKCHFSLLLVINLFTHQVNYAEPSLFSMFTFPFVQGNAKTAFEQLYSMVITEKTAKKFFGNEKNVIG